MDKMTEEQHSSNICSRNVLVDFRTGDESIAALENMGCTVYKTKKCSTVSEPVCGHPDIVIFRAGDKLICAPEMYAYYKELFGERVICGNTRLDSKYPADIAYNVCLLKNHSFGAFRYNDGKITEYLHSAGAVQINVNQGYTKCSISVVSEQAVITSDEGIYTKALAAGIDALKIREGFIRLDGVSYGFIGGASGLIDNKLWVINGELKTHPDGELIKSFVKKHNKTIVELKQSEIVDIGSIIQI